MQKDSFIQRLIVFFFHLLVITVPLFFTWVNNELFEFNKMLLTYAIGSTIIGLWFARMILAKKIIWQKSWFDLPIALFIISQVASTLFSMHPRTSWLGYYTRFHGGLLSILTYVGLFYAFIHNVKASQIKGFIWTTIGAALVACLYAIPEHFGVSPSCILINGNADTSCWSEATNPRFRIFGTFGQPNWLAAYVITILPVSFVVTIDQYIQKKYKPTLTAAFITTALFLTLLFTKSRSGFLGFAVSAVLLAAGTSFLLLKKNKTFAKKPVIKISSAIVALLVVLAGLFGTPFTPDLDSILQKTPAQQAPINQPSQPQPTQVVVNRLEIGGTDSGEIRKIVWQGSIAIWKRYPIFGSGLETFAYSYYLDRPVDHNNVSEWDFLYNKAHNELLNYLATTGLVGLAAYLILVSILILKPLHHTLTHKTTPFAQLLAIASASGLIALSISNFFGFSTVMITIMMFLIPASHWVLTNKNPQKIDQSEHQTTIFQLAGFGVITVVVLLAIGQVTTWWRADVSFNTGKQLADAGQLGTAQEFARQAVEMSPNEALFHDQLSIIYAGIAVTLHQQNEATAAAIYTQAAETASAATFQLNPVHLNFYKTQARMYLLLANIDQNYYVTALNILREGIKLAPTDAKIWYNMALIEDALGDRDQAKQLLDQAVFLKPNYEQARMALGEYYEQQGEYQAAADQYQTILESIAPSNTIAARKLELLEASISAQQAQ